VSERPYRLTIVTPEGVSFEYQLATPVVRFLALAVDISVIYTLMTALAVAVVLLGWVSGDLARAFFVILYFALGIGYFIFLEVIWRGQTLGKKLFRLRVADSSGLKLQTSQLVIRNLLRFVDSLPVLYFFGGAWAILSRRSQRLGDIAAGTVVLRLPAIKSPDLGQVSAQVYNSFRDYPRLEAVLRQAVSPELAETSLQALQRRDDIEPAARMALYSRLADRLRELVQFPDEIAASLSDEQYIRNCVDTIYRVAK